MEFNSLTVVDSASLDMQPTNQTVIEGAMATFHCNATGNPTPKIRWIKDGKTVGEEDTLSFVTKRNDSGRYWCLADNGLNATVKAIAYLNVQCEYIFTNETFYTHRQLQSSIHILTGSITVDYDLIKQYVNSFI